MADVRVYNKGKRTYEVSIPKGKKETQIVKIMPGRSIETDSKTADKLVSLYPRELSKSEPTKAQQNEVKKLKGENKSLSSENEALKKRLEELEASAESVTVKQDVEVIIPSEEEKSL